MWIKIGIGVAVSLVVFLGYVSTRSGKFLYERSGLVQASPEAIFPYLSQFKLGAEWSYYEKADPVMKKNIVGPDGQVGTIFEFESKTGGTGSLEFLKIEPNTLVQMRLLMTKPFKGDNLVEYKLAPEGEGTRFTWTMSGEGGFMTKLMTTLIDCEKMVGGQFDESLKNLKAVVEGKKQ